MAARLLKTLLEEGEGGTADFFSIFFSVQISGSQMGTGHQQEMEDLVIDFSTFIEKSKSEFDPRRCGDDP